MEFYGVWGNIKNLANNRFKKMQNEDSENVNNMQAVVWEVSFNNIYNLYTTYIQTSNIPSNIPSYQHISQVSQHG